MAKTGVFEGDAAMAAKATELKKELQRLVRAIVEDEDFDFSVQAVDRAAQTLFELKELKKKRPVSLKLSQSSACPEEFRCPISKEIMRDPVIVATGQVSSLILLRIFLFYVGFVRVLCDFVCFVTDFECQTAFGGWWNCGFTMRVLYLNLVTLKCEFSDWIQILTFVLFCDVLNGVY